MAIRVGVLSVAIHSALDRSGFSNFGKPLDCVVVAPADGGFPGSCCLSGNIIRAVVEGGGVFGQRQIKICGIDMRFIPVDQRDIVSENADIAAIVRVAVNNTCVDQ